MYPAVWGNFSSCKRRRPDNLLFKMLDHVMTRLFVFIYVVLVASLFSVSAPPAEADPSCLRTSRRFIAAAQTNTLTHSCLFIQPPSLFLLLLSLSCLHCFHLPVFQLKVKETTATHSDVCSTSRPLAIKASMRYQRTLSESGRVTSSFVASRKPSLNLSST